jgi:hypothetical protein
VSTTSGNGFQVCQRYDTRSSLVNSRPAYLGDLESGLGTGGKGGGEKCVKGMMHSVVL